MTRTHRLFLAAAVACTALAPVAPAFAEPDIDPPCRMRFEDEPMFTTSSDSPVQLDGPGRPYWVC